MSETDPAIVGAHPIVLFDGVCNLCEWAVQFIIKRDRKALFRFASLQSAVGKRLQAQHQLPDSLDSFILIEDGKVFWESTAALRVARKLRMPWPLFWGFRFLPAGLRDGGYRFIARNRYRWFGKKDSCLMPTPALKARLLE